MSQIKLGCIAKDKITGIVGTVTELLEFDNGTFAAALTPKGEAENKEPMKPFVCEQANLEVIDSTAVLETPLWTAPPFGSRVRNKFNNYTGFVRGRAFFLQGCERVAVYSDELYKGRPIGVCWFDVVELEVLTAQQETEMPRKGGPISTLDRR